MIKKIPLRTCCVTREKLPKQELIRVVRNTNNEVVVDLTGKVNGHGAYIKKDLETLEKAKKSKALARALEIEISTDVYLELEKVIKSEVI